MGKFEYKRGDAAKDTGASKKAVDRAWHAARDHAREDGEIGPGSEANGKFSDRDAGWLNSKKS